MQHDAPKSPEIRDIATAAFEAHAAMMKATADNPKLRSNEHWRALCDTALARATAALEAL